jgi:hypothetical protein
MTLHVTWLELRWDSIQIHWIQIQLSLGFIEFLFKFLIFEYMVWHSSFILIFLIEFNLKFNWIQIQLKRNEMQIDAWGIENMLVTVVLKKIASKNTDSKNTFLSYLEQILNQNLVLYLWNLNLSTLYKLQRYHHHWS